MLTFFPPRRPLLMMPLAELFVHVYVVVADALSGGAVPVPRRPAGRRRAPTRRC